MGKTCVQSVCENIICSFCFCYVLARKWMMNNKNEPFGYSKVWTSWLPSLTARWLIASITVRWVNHLTEKGLYDYIQSDNIQVTLWVGETICLWGHLSSRIAVVVLVLVPQDELFRECLLDHLVSHLFTHALCEDSRGFVLITKRKRGGLEARNSKNF